VTEDGLAESRAESELAQDDSRSVALNHSVDRLDCSAEQAEYLAGFH
jgi:hypothetical protein